MRVMYIYDFWSYKEIKILNMIKIFNFNIFFGINSHNSLCYLPGLLWKWSC